MQGYKLELPFSFGSVRVEINLTGRYSDRDDQSDDRIRAAAAVCLLQVPQWIQDNQITASDDSLAVTLPQAPRGTGGSATAGRHGQTVSQSTGGVQRSDLCTDPLQSGSDDTCSATTRIQSGSGSIDVKINMQGCMMRPEFIQTIANAVAATVMNHADSAINNQAPRNDAFLQLTRYLDASRSLDPHFRQHDELVGSGPGMGNSANTQR